MNCNDSFLNAQQNGCAMGLTASPFLPSIKQVADQILVQRVRAGELGDADALAIKSPAGLLGRKGGGHSVHTCAFVFMWG